MKAITIDASTSYRVLIDHGIRKHTGEEIRKISNAKKAAIISDSNVAPLYGKELTELLIQADFQVYTFVFTAGEASKNADTYFQILSFLAEHRFTRNDILIALGGGVTGDMTGFCAATYLRGIDYIQIPTSLLAMVDSSVGGKTAIDLPAGKNLVGAFYQPRLVLCDLDMLDTLPNAVFQEGCAEIIKYGVLFDRDLFEHLKVNGLDFNRNYVISACIEHKKNIVMNDEYDKGLRQLLNFGHTIGHSIEANSNYEISHGYAVAAGMAIISKASEQMDLCSPGVYDELVHILNRFGLPCSCRFSEAELYDKAISDKKSTGDTITLVIPREIGQCTLLPVRFQDFKSIIKAGL